MDLERALAKLPDGCRAAFVLHDVEGLEHREVGQALGIAEGTSKSQVHKARQRLRASHCWSAADHAYAHIANRFTSSSTARSGAIRRAELERHLADCAECRAFLADHGSHPRHGRYSRTARASRRRVAADCRPAAAGRTRRARRRCARCANEARRAPRHCGVAAAGGGNGDRHAVAGVPIEQYGHRSRGNQDRRSPARQRARRR